MRPQGTAGPAGLLVAVLAVAACGALAAAPGPPAPAAARSPAAAYAAEVDTWREERLADLRRPDGWLSLAGLYWLAEGDSTVGADPASDLVFPAGKAPPRLGVLHRSGRQVSFTAAPGADVRHEGEAVARLDLVSDTGGEPTTLEHGSLRFYLIERGDRVGLRLKDLGAELLGELTGIDHYPVDAAWRVTARFEPFAEPRMIPVPNITGDVLEQPGSGRIVFSLGGVEHALVPLGEPDSELFVVFGDRTNGRDTYGGGRFLDAGRPDAEGRLVVDFNKAYNPPCVFTPYATCPLPPPGNRLPLAVTAGEKALGAGH